MEIKNLIRSSEEDRAVSPVIGVILMVAITVILAAVIGTFVLGLGDQVQQTAPNAQFSFDYDSSTPSLEVTHDGGEGIEGDELTLRGDVTGGTNWQDAGHSTVTAGSSVTVANSGGDWSWDGVVTDGDVDDGSEVRVVWEDSDSDRSSTLRTWTK